MTLKDIRIELADEAEQQFHQILDHSVPWVSKWGRRYLEFLSDLPGHQWKALAKGFQEGKFKTAHPCPFDIQGKVFIDPWGRVQKVLITRFQTCQPVTPLSQALLPTNSPVGARWN